MVNTEKNNWKTLRSLWI